MTKKSIFVSVTILAIISTAVYTFRNLPSAKSIVETFIYMPRCNKYDIDLEIPKQMKNSIIRFEKPISIQSTEKVMIKKGCPGILQDTEEYITTSNDEKKLDERSFIVLKHVYTNCHNALDINCFEGTPGDQYLIQDLSNMNKYIISASYFGHKTKNYSNIVAGYYDKNNHDVRLGDVEIQPWVCYKGDNGNMCEKLNY